MIKVFMRNLEFKIDLYLVRQITDRVVSGLILTKVFLKNLEFEVNLYLLRKILEDTEGYT